MHVDSIALALLQKQLDHISHQMGWAMTRTARSPIFSESNDFSCFITDQRGQLVSVADGLPIHTGGGGFAVEAVLRDFKDDMEDGDVFLLSDPYEAGGNHLPDWTIIRPVFVVGELLAFTCNRAHQSDIGGGAPGAYNAAATEIYQEGIRLPVVKLVSRGETRRDLWKLLLLNSRTPHLLDGDLRAMLGSTAVGAEKVGALAVSAGIEETRGRLQGILDHAERVMRNAIGKIPKGIFRATEGSDNDCFGPADIRFEVEVRVHDDSIEVDFTGTSPQIRGFKNSSLANTHSAVYMAVLTCVDASVPKNAGTFRPISITAPKGSVVNANPPAPMTMSTVHPAAEIIHAVWRALGQAQPELACAGWGKSVHCISSGDEANGDTFVLYHWHAYPGGGAVNGMDGLNMVGALCTLGGFRTPNVETYERKYPVTIRRQEFRADAAGAGRHRGGTGVHYVADVHVPARHMFRGEGVRTPSGFGCAEGSVGAKGDVRVTLQDGTSIQVPQYGILELPPCTIEIDSPGGGGWGDPKTRRPDDVQRDVVDGVISAVAAEADYGVVLNPDRSLDREATKRCRNGRQQNGE